MFIMNTKPNDYLNSELFHSIIAKHFLSTPSFVITKFENKTAVGVGENFASTILKNCITLQLPCGSTQQMSFISKIVGSDFIDEDSLNEMKVFPKEMEMYQTIIPALEKIWKDVGHIDVVFGPKLYYGEMEPHKMLIFENLNESDHKMLNRLNGLNEQQVFSVLEKLAKWHAASKIYIDRSKIINPIFLKGMFHSGLAGFFYGYFNLLHNSLIESLNDCNDIDPKYLDIMRSWNGKIIPHLTKLTTYDPNDFNVLNHGDLWINNIMLKCNDDVATPIDVKFIDYQLGIYASPAIDLLYFLTLSVHHELITLKYNEFITYYHQQLVTSLKHLNYDKIPTLKELYGSLHKNSFYGAMLLIEGVATILVDHQIDDIDIKVYGTDSELGAETRKKLFAVPRTKDAIKGLIRFYGSRGMLDL